MKVTKRTVAFLVLVAMAGLLVGLLGGAPALGEVDGDPYGVHWLRIGWSDYTESWWVTWPFGYDEPLTGEGWILANETSQNVCWRVDEGGPCDCRCEWQSDDGWCGCFFENDDFAMDLFRKNDDPLTCEIALWWEYEPGHAHFKRRFVGPCSFKTLLPAVMNGADQ